MSLNFLKLNNKKTEILLVIGSAASVKRMDLSFDINGVHVKPSSSILNLGVSKIDSTHSKKCWVVLTQFWVKYGQTQPLGYIFNPMFELVHS